MKLFHNLLRVIHQCVFPKYNACEQFYIMIVDIQLQIQVLK